MRQILELLVVSTLAGRLAAAQAPEPADTLRLTTGAGGAPFAWGTVRLRTGACLRAYLPAGAVGTDTTLPYYLAPPDRGHPVPKTKYLKLSQVQSMLVRGQYSELLPGNLRGPITERVPDRLAARLVSGGAVELFVVKVPPALAVSFLGPTPVLSAPAANGAPALVPALMSYYLRRSGRPSVLVDEAQFATQLADFMADDKELTQRILARQPGYRYAELASLVAQYNQHARP